MDDIVIRPRYPRHSVAGKKRKRYSTEKSSINILLARQIFISLIILIIAFAVKNINSPLALTVQDKIKYVLTADSNIGELMASLEKTFSEAWNSKSINGSTSATDGQSTGETSGLTSETSSAAEDKTQTSGLNNSGTTSSDASVLPDSDAANDSIPASSTDGILMVTAPVKGTLSSAFGERTDPVTGTVKMHEGIDIEADKGKSVAAALAGTVMEAGSSKSYGNYIKIKHQGNLVTVYAHCSKINVTKGQTVKQGEIIAEVGSTGLALGDHLHFEVWSNGKAVNPLDYVSIAD